MQPILKIFSKVRIVFTIVLASLFLSGCVDYDLAINFANQTHGEIVQHIQLGQQFTSFSGSTVQEWLDSIKQRTRQLGGKTRKLQDGELLVTIPFNNGAELEQKFNLFFNPLEANKARPTTDITQFKSNLKIFQNNWLFAIRNRLVYDLDLSSFSMIGSDGNVLISPGSAFDLDFHLNTPWGAKLQSTEFNDALPTVEEKNLSWKIKPGEFNHIEAVFWVPSPIGIGSLVIIVLVVLGGALKYQLLPVMAGNKQKTAV